MFYNFIVGQKLDLCMEDTFVARAMKWLFICRRDLVACYVYLFIYLFFFFLGGALFH